MPVYIATTLVSTLSAFFAFYFGKQVSPPIFQKIKQGQKNAILFLLLAVFSALVFVFIYGFRYGVGTDYFFTYEPLISGMQQGTPPETMIVEPAFWYLCVLLSSLGLGITWLMLISGAVIMGFFWLAFFKQSQLPWLSVFLFVATRHFFISMNCVRQYMAMAIVLFGFQFIKQKCFWKYAICVGVAMLFHTSAIILLFVYFLRYIKLNPFIGTGILAVMFIFKAQIMQFLQWLVSKTPYAWYMESIWADSPPFYPEKFWAMLPLALVACVYYFINNNKNNPMYRVYYLCQLGIIFITLNRNILPLTERVSWMLEMTTLLFIPMVISNEKRKWVKILLSVLLIGSALWFTYYEIFQNGYHETQLYRFVFMPEIAFM